MSVLLPNTALALRRQEDLTPDSHGDLVPGGWADPTPAYPGRVTGGGANLQGGESIYNISVDPALWPMKPKDLVVEYQLDDDGNPVDVATGREWFIRTADNIRHSEDASVNYVRIQGQIRVGVSTTP
jgi:hypothetical protein